MLKASWTSHTSTVGRIGEMPMSDKVRAIIARPDARWIGQNGKVSYHLGAKYLLCHGRHPHAHTLARARVFMKNQPKTFRTLEELLKAPTPRPPLNNAERRVLIIAGQIDPVPSNPDVDVTQQTQAEIPVAYEQATQAAFLQSAKEAERERKFLMWGTLLIGIAALAMTIIAVIAIKAVFFTNKGG